MIDHYSQYDDHLAFTRKFAAERPPCWRCRNEGYYLCAMQTEACKARLLHSHPCDCVQSGYAVAREDRWYRRCMDAKEPYVAGGWKLKDPASAPGVLEYRGGVTIADLRGDHDYGPLLAGKDDFEAFRLLLESIHGTEAERQNLERQPGASMSARREKKWHLVDALPWCDEHDRPLHLREGTGPYGGYAFYSCPASLGGGAYCPVKVNARDLREAL